MSPRRYTPLSESFEEMPTELRLPTERPIAIYYRQSTDAQIGNISTTLQTVDMVAYLKQRGWAEEKIVMIDMDAGISGTTKIDEKPAGKKVDMHKTLSNGSCNEPWRRFAVSEPRVVLDGP